MFFNKIGLGVVFSQSGTKGQSTQPYEGRTIGGGGGGYPLRTPKKDPNGAVTAWDSEEQILSENGTLHAVTSKDIVVAREVAVESESGSLKEPSGWTVSAEGGSWKTHP